MSLCRGALAAAACILVLTAPSVAVAEPKGDVRSLQQKPRVKVRQIIAGLRSGQVKQRAACATLAVSLGPESAPALLEALASANRDESWLAAAILRHAKLLRPEHVGPLTKVLQTGKPHARRHAAELLGLLGPPAAPAAGELGRALAKGDAKLHLAAAEALRHLGPKGIKELIGCLGSPAPGVAPAAADALGSAHHQAEAAVPALVKALRSRDRELQYQAAWALYQIGSWDPMVVEALTAACAAEECPGLEAVRLALAKMGPAAGPAIPALVKRIDGRTLAAIDPKTVEHIIPLCSARDAKTRGKAILALRYFPSQSDQVVPLLIRRLRDPNMRVAGDAATALGLLGVRACKAIPDLTDALRGRGPYARIAREADVDLFFWNPVAIALTEIRQAEGVKILASVAADAKLNGWQRLVAMEILGLVGPKAAPAAGALAKVMRSKRPAFRYGALKALDSIDARDKATVEALVAAIGDPEEDIAEHAVSTISDIGPAARSAAPVLLAEMKAVAGGHKSARIQMNFCAEALGATGRGVPGVAEFLEGQLEQGNIKWAAWYAEALARVKPDSPAAVRYLIWILKTHHDEDERKKAAEVLGKLGARAKPAVAALMQALHDKHVDSTAAYALGELGPLAAGAVEALALAVTDRKAYMEESVCWALPRIGPKAKAAIPILMAEAWLNPARVPESNGVRHMNEALSALLSEEAKQDRK